MIEKRTNSRSMAKQFTRNYLIISFIPLILLLILIVASTWLSTKHLASLIVKSTYDLNEDAEKNLQELGEKIIQAKARDVAKQIDMYFRMHPDMSIPQMRKDPLFMDLAIQQVGKTGYTAMTEAFTYLFRVHPNAKLNDTDMRPLAKKLPSWGKIVEKGITGDEAMGYYDWKEPDGTFRKKYLVATPVKTRVNGIIMMVSATTYIDEFSEPVVDMRKKADLIVDSYKSYVLQQSFVYSIIVVIVMLLTFVAIYFMGRRAGLRYIMPITQLAETSRKFGEGDWDAKVNEEVLKRDDEIGTLAEAYYYMSLQLKGLFGSLEQRLGELKETQEALKKSEEHYRSLFAGVPVGLYRTTPDGTVLDANPTLISMMGYPDRESFISINAYETYVDPVDRKAWQEKMIKGGGIQSFQTRMRKYDGTEIWIENNSSAVLDEKGNVQYYEGSLKDITEQKESDEALKRSEEQYRDLYENSKKTEEVYRSLLNSSADAIVIYDIQGNVNYVSPMFTKIFGWTEEELKGQKIPFVPHVEMVATEKVFNNVIKHGIPSHGFESMRTTKDGRIIDVSISASRYDDHAGKASGMLVILRDISERKRLEAQLHHVERMEAIGTLAGGIAHDFNNLLMVIQGSISIMLYGMDKSHPHYKNFKNIEKQVKRGSQLTSQLLGYARKGRYEVRAVNINEIIIDTMDAISRTRKDITINYKLSDEINAIEGDIYQIEQVLMNLYINAFDAMPDGGELYIETKNSMSDEIESGVYEPSPGKYVMIAIRDTGIGMDTKTMDHIFEPFFTTKAMDRGTGLGLASVYGIVKAHGGYINVESSKGEGSVFTVYLPASDKIIEISVSEPKKILEGAGVILLIDDEELVLEVGSKMLESLGYTVLKAGTVLKAIDILKKNKEKINLVVLDMIMPEIGGSQAFDMIKEIKPDIGVLLSSGYSIDGKAEDILSRGCDGFIQKPYSIEELSEKIKQIIKEV